MLYQSNQAVCFKDGYYSFGAAVTARADAALDNDILRGIFSLYLHSAASLTVTPGDKNTCIIGDEMLPEVGDADYAVRVTPKGIALAASDDKALRRAFLTLLDFVEPVCLEAGKEAYRVPCFTYSEKPQIGTRMVHLCIFPETEYTFFRKFVRLCGVLQFTHIVLEFWGMLQYDCLRELGWKHAWTKDMVKAAVADANALGMEVIPMFNHLGHAAGSRSCSGKHVVLDQNPRLATYFTEDGWVWAIEKPEVRALLRKVRGELIDLCGSGSYFHIGCDEAYVYGDDREKAPVLVDYIGEIVEDLEKQGRKAILWGDMFLKSHGTFKYPENRYYCNCRDEVIEKIFLDGLDRRAVIADWQYEAPTAPFETSLFFKEQGFATLVCPWETLNAKNTFAAAETVKNSGMDGYMLTTWHTHDRLQSLIKDALMLRDTKLGAVDYGITAGALLRRIWFVDGNYADAGWKTKQVVQQFS